ncbi:MAG: calcium-translocating P-type ATPase, PMCA-type [Bacillota bacterium]|nr:calcium-translocating P-type ATPase, PMCA-type [Bacillota bacterium]
MYRQTIEDLIKQFNTNIKIGLSNDQVEPIRENHGYNELEEKKPPPLWKKFFKNFKDFMIFILIAAAVISFALGEKTDAFIIIAIVLINAVISTYQEMKAEESISSLKSLTATKCVVLRNGEKIELDTRFLVPGDIVYIEAGNFVPADGRLIESSNLKIEESTLTGESVPVEKSTIQLDADNLQIGDQVNMVFTGTIVTYGSGKFLITSTGMKTQLGKIATLISEDKETLTPLQIKLDEIGKIIGVIVLLISAIIFIVGIVQGRDTFDMFFIAVSLAVAAIPEGLPAIVTIVLALGVRRLSQKNAVIRKLPAVETLGSSSVICSDKTGTLTQNKMTVMDFFTMSDKDKKTLIISSILCNDATITSENEIGDPTETALIRYGLDNEFTQNNINAIYPRIDGLPFDSDRKMMSTVHADNTSFISFTKGAVDEIITRCNYILIGGIKAKFDKEKKDKILQKNKFFAEKALRVLGFASKDYEQLPSEITSITIEDDMTFIGLLAMMDPPREEAKISIKKCLAAGIKPVMITGDHKITATVIARDLGILKNDDEIITGNELSDISDEDLIDSVQNYSVYARVSPEHKVKIVKAWQSNNQVVAMTGDGVNDAPALRMADIGIAMGKVGTDVSRNAASMVLMDDNFSTIVLAIEEGRGIYSNIKKSICYLLSCNFGEIILLLLAMLMNLKVPLLPIHILWINLVTDSFPALALGVEPKDKNILGKSPRKKDEGIFSNGLIYKITFEGLLVGLIALGIFIYGLSIDITVARTMTFLTLAFSQLVHSINVRSDDSIIFIKGLFSNKYSLYAILTSVILQVFIVSIPLTQKLFKVTHLSFNQWTIVILSSLIPLFVIELFKIIKSLSSK